MAVSSVMRRAFCILAGKDVPLMNTKMQILFSDTRIQRCLTIVLLLLFAVVSVQYTLKVTDDERRNRSAFLRWRNQILSLEDGINIYNKYEYPNPPIMALLLRPFAAMPPLVGSLLWFYLKVVMVFLVFRWVFRLVAPKKGSGVFCAQHPLGRSGKRLPTPFSGPEQHDRPFPAWAKALAIVLSIRPILGDLTHGNINIFILFLVVAALYAFRRGRDYSSGLLLALAIACKLTPALFIPYFLWKRAWKTLAGCAVGLFLFLWLVPGMILGANYNARLFGGWVHQMIIPYVLEGEVTSEHQNQSLPGLMHRLLTHSASFSEFAGMQYVPVEYHNVADLNPALVSALVKICILVFAGLVMWNCRTPKSQRLHFGFAAEFSLILLGMLLFSERTWKHHCVTLIVPIATVLYSLAVYRFAPRLRYFVIGCVIVALALMTSTSTGLYGESYDRAAKLAQVYGAYLWAHLILAAVMIVLLRAFRVSVPVTTTEPQILSLRVRKQERLDDWMVAEEAVPVSEEVASAETDRTGV